MCTFLGSIFPYDEYGGLGGALAEDWRLLVQAGRLLQEQAALAVRARLRRPPAHARQTHRVLTGSTLLQTQSL